MIVCVFVLLQNPYLERVSLLALLPAAHCFCSSNSLSLAYSQTFTYNGHGNNQYIVTTVLVSMSRNVDKVTLLV